jgi:ribosome recycling factor
MNTTELKSKLTKSTEFLRSELSQIRTGRASPSLLEEIAVDAYGTKMSIRELASISLLDTQNLAVVPWDKGLLKSISKAIRENNLNLNPVDEAERVRVPVPALTEERRKELAKVVSVKVEDCKNAIRNTRQDAMKDIEASFASKEIGEDDKFRQKEDVEKIVKTFVDQCDEMGESKKDELMTI